MKIKVTNTGDRAVGVDGGLPLPPGETGEFEVDEDTLSALEGFEHVEIQHLDRPEGGSHPKAAAKAGNKGPGK
jgi:hypothetical protein